MSAAPPPSRPRAAMILAAGLGTRMGPLTKERPKPLVEVAGTPLIEFSLGRLEEVGVDRIVVNVHYMADVLRDFLSARAGKGAATEIVISDETEQLMDTGGGVKKALGALGPEPFYVVNSDIMWMDGVNRSFDLLADRWCDQSMDALLLLAPTVSAVGYQGRGDFLMSSEGRLKRRPEQETAPFVFAGVQIVHPRLFSDCPEGPFSLNLVWDRALEAGRLYGVRREGRWFHVGSPEGVEAAEKWFKG